MAQIKIIVTQQTRNQVYAYSRFLHISMAQFCRDAINMRMSRYHRHLRAIKGKVAA